MNYSDLPEVRILCAELGYQVEEKELVDRYNRIRNSKNHELFVAEADNSIVIGWTHIFQRSPHLCSAPKSELGGLIVSENYRGKGVGKLLLQQAETWSLKNELGELVLTSNAKRELAHKFYINLGYKIRKTSYWIGKELV